MAAAIELHNLVFRYGDRTAVQGISLTVEAGAIFGMLGPNGGGKSTTLRVLSTLAAPTEGTALVAGYDVVDQPDQVRQAIGVAFQNPALDLKLTVRENLRHHGHLYGLSGHELRHRIDRAVSDVGLADRADDLVETLSGGMRRRAEIAKVLLHEPQVLLLDEPTTGLDPGARAALWQQLKRLRAERGCTVLMATHLFEDAEQCDRIAIIDQGRLAGTGTPDELKRMVGGEVLTLQCDDPESVLEGLRNLLPDAEPTCVGNQLRIEHPIAHNVVPQLAEQFGDRVRSIRLGQPTLADVFFKLTGHEFNEAA